VTPFELEIAANGDTISFIIPGELENLTRPSACRRMAER
jgi:hypothetical protein